VLERAEAAADAGILKYVSYGSNKHLTKRANIDSWWQGGLPDACIAFIYRPQCKRGLRNVLQYERQNSLNLQ